MSNPAMAPSLAGIVNDPLDESRRVVPSSQRADGSLRKERKVKPGHVPSEDVAKYRPGQGNLRAQHAMAQANHQAPPSPSPSNSLGTLPSTPATASARRPSPADFLTFSNAAATAAATQQKNSVPLPTPPASPTKPTSSLSSHKGASASRWASAPTPAPPSAPAATTEPTGLLTSTTTPAPAAIKEPMSTAVPTPTSPKPSRTPANKARTKPPRKEKWEAPGPSVAPVSTVSSVEKENIPVVHDEEKLSSVSPPKTTIPSLPTTPESKLPDLPETPGGDWWAEDDDDEDVASAAQALQGISIKDIASNPNNERNTSPTRQSIHTNGLQHVSQQAQAHAIPVGNASARDLHSKTKKPQPKSTPKSTPAKGGTAGPDLLSRLGPPVPPQQQESKPEKASTPIVPAMINEKASSTSLTLDQFLERARELNAELRQLNQLKRYAAAGAVLSNEQNAHVKNMPALLQELSDINNSIHTAAKEIAILFSSAQI